MATSEEISFVYGTLKLIDDTATTPLSHTVTLKDGDISLSNLRSPYLNEEINSQTNGTHKSTMPGERLYPEVTFSARVDTFASGSTLIDFLNGDGTYSAVVNTDTSSPIPHRHVTLEYARETNTRSIALEDVSFGYVINESGSVRLEWTGTVKGRVFADGQLVAREYGASTSVPSWVPTVA